MFYCRTGRRGGMADAADSKSVYGDIVRVQVPPPAFTKAVRIGAVLTAFSLLLSYKYQDADEEDAAKYGNNFALMPLQNCNLMII